MDLFKKTSWTNSNLWLLIACISAIVHGGTTDSRLISLGTSPCEPGDFATPLYRLKVSDTASDGEYYLRECSSGGSANLTNWNIVRVTKDLKLRVILDAQMQQPKILASGKNGLPNIEDITCIRNGVDSIGKDRIACDTSHFKYNGNYYPTHDNQAPSAWTRQASFSWSKMREAPTL